jgi:ubiquinone/menaquinone biosynthesis C-methylase UbiE
MKLYFGCGNHKVDGFIGVDKVKTEHADIVHDMNAFPYPFKDNTVDEVLLSHILEHLPDTIKVMEEIWRICKNRAAIKIFVPYYNSLGACQDPTHVKFFTEHSFDYFTENGATTLSVYNYYTSARFRIMSIIPMQRSILTTLPKKIQWFLAHHLSTVHSIEVLLQVIK